MSDYCKHGTYVGGCGIDWMCGPCEAGDPDPTINELLAERQRLATTLSTHLRKNVLPFVISPDPDHSADTNARIVRAIWQHTAERLLGQINNITYQISHVRQWATGPDDDDWLARRHRHNLALAEINYYNY